MQALSISNEKVQLVNPQAAMMDGAHSKGSTPNGLDTLAAVGLHELSAKIADSVLAMVIASSTGKHRTEFLDGQRAGLARDLESRALPGALAPIRIVVGLRSAFTVLWRTRGGFAVPRLRFRSDRDRAIAKPLDDHRVLEACEPSSAGGGSWSDQRSSGSWWPTRGTR